VRSASGAAAAVLLLVILLWASNSIMAKIVLREIDPLTLTWLRFLIAGGFYLPYAVLTRAERARARIRDDELWSGCSTEAQREHKALDMANKAVL
jgi:drug/metabolite transporter (DMT)-like permease